MKLRIIASTLLILLFSIAVNANAQRYRGYHRGYCRPHCGVRVWAPATVVVPPVVVGGYYGPRHYAPAYYGPRYYHRPFYGGYRHYGGRYYR